MTELTRFEGEVAGTKYAAALNGKAWRVQPEDGLPPFKVPTKLATYYPNLARGFVEDWIKRVVRMKKRAR
jgi:hypothetical protein